MIYVITTLKIDHGVIVRERTVGYFLQEHTAVLALQNNWRDIHEEGFYNYAVLETVQPGIYPLAAARFFEWHDSGFYPCGVPQGLGDVTNFAIG